jgi:hypothetical protein
MSQAYENTDRTLYTEPNKDWKDEGYMPKIFVTKEGSIGMEVGGMVYVRTIREWFNMAKQNDLLKDVKQYTKRPQDNNALVPLDFQVIFDMLFDRTQYSVDSCKDIAEEICAKFGKDNSGMVPDEKELSLLFDMLKTHKVNYLPELLTQPTGIIGIDQAFSTFKIWLSKFSQQPPKERKVSLEEIVSVIGGTISQRSHPLPYKDAQIIGQEILNLLNRHC